MMTKRYRAAVPIRTLLITVFVVSVFMFGAFLFLGGLSIDNGVPMNSSLKAQYLNITNNQSLPKQGTLSFIGKLNALAAGQQNSTANINSAFNAGTSIGLAAGYFGSLGNIYNSVISVISTALSFMGVPTAFVHVVANLALIVLVFVAILSAVFLFPI